MTKKKWIRKYGFPVNKEEFEFTSFELSLIVDNGNLTGIATEQEFSKYSNEIITVKGFIESDIISFIKTYPHLYQVDESGNVVINKVEKGHDVIYSGTYNKSQNTWNGNCEIILSEYYDDLGQLIIETINGPWEMS